MKRIRRIYIRIMMPIMMMLLLLIGVLGCSDSTRPRTGPATISGRVTDSDGLAVAQAALMVSFRPSFEDVLQPLLIGKTGRDLPPPENVESFLVLDPCGNQVRDLCDGDCAGATTIIWDGLDDQGRRVAEGLYYFQAVWPDSSLSQELILIHNYVGWDPVNDGHHGLTDQDGNFQIDDACLGLGTMIDTTDEQGNFVDRRPIQRLVNLHLLTRDGRGARRDSVLWPESGNLPLDFVVPALP